MSLSPFQKSQDLLQSTKLPLIFIPPYPKTDVLASALALFLFFEKKGVVAKIICDTAESLEEDLSFIHPLPALAAELTGARDFVLSFQTKYNPIAGVRTERDQDELRIFITPAKASIDPRDFSFQPSSFSHDLVIVIGAPDKEHLGKCYETNPDVFYEVPIINIDASSENELFGQINLVDITASTVSEIVSELLAGVLIADELPLAVHEYLLTGIITGTQSFQKQNTSPKALKIASDLMDKGADQQKIIRALYKTQPLHLLKLWGKVMANIKWNEKKGIIWGTLSVADFVQARANAKDLPAVLEKIKTNYLSAKVYMLLYQEDATHVRVLLTAHQQEETAKLQLLFPGGEIQGEILSLQLTKDSLEAAEESLLLTFGS
jgi:nanoRNase/pAp phosphatase (c-di-AMP/oligoRNAs hydrolase)